MSNEPNDDLDELQESYTDLEELLEGALSAEPHPACEKAGEVPNG